MANLHFYPLLAVLAAAHAPAPTPGEARIFGDWAVGCDNTGQCTAVSLAPGWDGPDPAPITLIWAAQAGADPVITVDGDQVLGGAIEVDGNTVIAPGKPLAGPAARRMVAAMAKGRQAAVNSRRGEDQGRSSLRGFTAALLYIEEQHGRIGTREAILRPGPRRYRRHALTAPVITVPRPGSDPVPKIDQAKLFAEDGCEAAAAMPGDREVVVARLDPQTSLVLVPWRCNNGAYNFHSSVMLASNAGVLRPAQLDYPGGMSGEPDGNDLTNAYWDPDNRQLQSAPLGRGLGDCGTQNSYAWDGVRFRLILREVMPDCRGSKAFLTVWQMRAVSD